MQLPAEMESKTPGTGVPRLSGWPVRNWATQQGVSLPVMGLNHPETISPPQVRGKIIFYETDPWCQKGWGMLPLEIKMTFKLLYRQQGNDSSTICQKLSQHLRGVLC